MNENILSLEKLASNLQSLRCGQLKLFFSYRTVIAFQCGDKLTVSENVWSTTTGKHLAMIQTKDSQVISNAVFINRLKRVLELYQMPIELGNIY